MNPIPVWLQNLWDTWDVRVGVLVSVTLQIILTFFSGRRKYIRGLWLDILIWSSYVMADTIAIFCLTKLSDSRGADVYSNGIMVLWAPLLLLHLGGHDTITTNSIEDVRLWLRHVANVAIQVVIAVYVILRFWTGKSQGVSFLTFPLFVAGVSKYTERTLALRNPKFLLPMKFNDDKIVYDLNIIADGHKYSDAKLVLLSYLWLQAMAPCILSISKFVEGVASREVTSIIWNKGNIDNNAFSFFEIQLGFMYEVLYTKANRIYTKLGCLVRLVSFVCVTSVLVGYAAVSKHNYSTLDIIITYVLLVGAVILDVYGISLIIFSEITLVWMCKYFKYKFIRCYLRIISPLVVHSGKRWAGSIPTLNVLDLTLYTVKPPLLSRVLKYFEVEEKFKAFRCAKEVYELEPLKLVITKEVKILLNFFSRVDNWHRNYAERGEVTLDNRYVVRRTRELQWSFRKSLDISIIIWHIATTWCYYLDNADHEKRTFRKGAKILSDYMMYLLVNCPSMLGKGAFPCNLSALLGLYVNLMEGIVKMDRNSYDKADICKIMMTWEPNVCTPGPSGSPTYFEPLDYARIPTWACDLATTLLNGNYDDERWEIISEIWAEMLCYSAANAEPTEHLNRLSKGGEFISQVWIILFIHGLINPSPLDFLRRLFAKAMSEESGFDHDEV